MIQLIGFEALRKLTSDQLAAATDTAVGQALNAEAQIMMRNSKRLVPVDSGTLRRSGIILPVFREGSNWVILMGYGGAASGYAMDQHERADYRHKEGKTWKYLETPVRDRIPNLEAALAARVMNIIKKGTK